MLKLIKNSSRLARNY